MLDFHFVLIDCDYYLCNTYHGSSDDKRNDSLERTIHYI